MQNRVLLVKKKIRSLRGIQQARYTTHNTIFSAHACSVPHDLAK